MGDGTEAGGGVVESTASPRGELGPAVFVRGLCGGCGQPVTTADVGRMRDAERGVYFHARCHNAQCRPTTRAAPG